MHLKSSVSGLGGDRHNTFFVGACSASHHRLNMQCRHLGLGTRVVDSANGAPNPADVHCDCEVQSVVRGLLSVAASFEREYLRRGPPAFDRG